MKHTPYYHTKRKQALETIKSLSQKMTANAIARKYSVWPTEVRRALATGYVSPALVRAVIVPRKRVRFAADVSPELRAAIRAEADYLGMTNGELLDLIFCYWDVRDFYEVTE